MRSSIYQNVKTDREYRSATGLSKAQFEQLAVKFKEYYQVVEWEFPENFGQERAIKQAGEGLFLVLFYLKSYPVLDVLGDEFWGEPGSSKPVSDFVQVNFKDGFTSRRRVTTPFF